MVHEMIPEVVEEASQSVVADQYEELSQIDYENMGKAEQKVDAIAQILRRSNDILQ